MTRILLVTYHFPPSNQVGAQRPGRLARLLPDHGFDVDVVCASLEQAVGEADPSQLDLVPERGEIVRVRTPFVFGRHPYRIPAESERFRLAWWKTRAYVEALTLTRDWEWNWGVAALGAVRDSLPTYDAVVVNGPPFIAVVPLLRAARRLGTPTVCDLRDFWVGEPPSGSVLGSVRPKERRRRWSLRLRDESLRFANHVVLNSDETIGLMRRTLPDVDSGRISAITNAFLDFDERPSSPPQSTSDERRIRVCHTGQLAYGRDALAIELIRGIAVLKRRGGTRIELELAGQEVPEVAAAARDEGIADQVRILGWLNRDETHSLQREADALLLLQPGEYADVAIPGKLFEYMARRRPILGFMPDGSAPRIIREHGLGMVISRSDPGSIADELEAFVATVRERPYLPPPPEMFSERSTVEQFAQVLRSVVPPHGRAQLPVGSPSNV